MLTFSSQSLLEIIAILEEHLQTIKSGELLEFETVNPDIASLKYAGSLINEYIYRGYKAWTDLAEMLYCRMLTPIIKDANTVIIRFEKLNTLNSFHNVEDDSDKKYGSESIFAKINKTEEPAFLYHYLRALKNVKIDKRLRVLNIGINSGDEFDIIKRYSQNFDKQKLIGIDYCSSAIKLAQNKFPEDNITFINHDVNHIDSLHLDRFDLIISIGTLQSRNIDFKTLFKSLVKDYLTDDGALILGFPNCRWIDGEMIYGAKAKNYAFPEMSLLYKDIHYCKGYLQKHKFRVTITGKSYVFLTATSIR